MVVVVGSQPSPSSSKGCAAALVAKSASAAHIAPIIFRIVHSSRFRSPLLEVWAGAAGSTSGATQVALLMRRHRPALATLPWATGPAPRSRTGGCTTPRFRFRDIGPSQTLFHAPSPWLAEPASYAGDASHGRCSGLEAQLRASRPSSADRFDQKHGAFPWLATVTHVTQFRRPSARRS